MHFVQRSRGDASRVRTRFQYSGSALLQYSHDLEPHGPASVNQGVAKSFNFVIVVEMGLAPSHRDVIDQYIEMYGLLPLSLSTRTCSQALSVSFHVSFALFSHTSCHVLLTFVGGKGGRAHFTHFQDEGGDQFRRDAATSLWHPPAETWQPQWMDGSRTSQFCPHPAHAQRGGGEVEGNGEGCEAQHACGAIQ